MVDLQNKLLEKDEFLKSMENSMNEMKGTCEMVDELKQKLEEKDSAVKFAMSQLSCLKVSITNPHLYHQAVFFYTRAISLF